jgi:hypothetical protein
MVPMKVFLVALPIACFVGTFLGLADAQLPPGSIMTTGTAHSHSVSIPLSQMTTCPGAIGPAVPGPISKAGGNFLSDEFFCIKQPEVFQRIDSLSYATVFPSIHYAGRDRTTRWARCRLASCR